MKTYNNIIVKYRFGIHD